jgi:hypothetical protein
LFDAAEDIIPKRRLFRPFNFGVFFEIMVVGIGEIASEMDTATFFAGQGRLRNKEAYCEHVL